MKQGVQNVLYDGKIYRIIYTRCENNELLKEMKMNRLLLFYPELKKCISTEN